MNIIYIICNNICSKLFSSLLFSSLSSFSYDLFFIFFIASISAFSRIFSRGKKVISFSILDLLFLRDSFLDASDGDGDDDSFSDSSKELQNSSSLFNLSYKIC